MRLNLQYQKITPNLSYKLNISRAIAALIVMLTHWRGSLFVPYNELIESKNIINFALFFVTRLGHECVLVFFVLSGFLVGGQSLGEYFNGNFSLKKYFINRFSRMWAVVIPTLLLGFLIDWQSLQLDPSLDFGYKLTVPIFIGNLFFLQTIAVPSFGSNVPMWSLACEFWYYIIFPIFLFLGWSSSLSKVLKWSAIVVITVILSVLIPHIMKFFPIWILGVLIRFIPLKNKLKKPIWQWISLFFLALSISLSNYKEVLWANYLVGISFAFTIITWMQASESISNYFFKRAIEKLADFSFSMYAIHYFIIYYIVALLQKKGFGIRLQHANFLNWMLFLIVAIGITLVSFLFYWLFEKRTYLLRNKLYNWFSITKKVSR